MCVRIVNKNQNIKFSLLSAFVHLIRFVHHQIKSLVSSFLCFLSGQCAMCNTTIGCWRRIFSLSPDKHIKCLFVCRRLVFFGAPNLFYYYYYVFFSSSSECEKIIIKIIIVFYCVFLCVW